MNTSYTGHLENSLWDFAYSMDDTYESEEHYEVLDYQNASSTFRPFGEGLLSIIQKKYPQEKINIDSGVLDEYDIARVGLNIRDWLRQINA